jgi:protein-S-isoprenylcysteine O-methyltransferase Ste14
MHRLFVAVRALVYGAVFISLWGWVVLRVRLIDLDRRRFLPFWTGFVGVAALVVGAVVVLSCVVFFVVRGNGTQAPFDPPKEFVASGPYRLVRNPMYLGALLVVSGYGLYARSPSVLVLTVLMAVLVHLFVVFGEEPGLARRFGESYAAYCRATNRWIPRLERRT